MCRLRVHSVFFRSLHVLLLNTCINFIYLSSFFHIFFSFSSLHFSFDSDRFLYALCESNSSEKIWLFVVYIKFFGLQFESKREEKKTRTHESAFSMQRTTISVENGTKLILSCNSIPQYLISVKVCILCCMHIYCLYLSSAFFSSFVRFKCYFRFKLTNIGKFNNETFKCESLMPFQYLLIPLCKYHQFFA